MSFGQVVTAALRAKKYIKFSRHDKTLGQRIIGELLGHGIQYVWNSLFLPRLACFGADEVDVLTRSNPFCPGLQNATFH